MRRLRREMLVLGTTFLGAGVALAARAGAASEPAAPAGSAAPATVALAAGGWVSDVDKEVHRQVWKAFQESRPHVTLDINEIAFTTDKLLTSVAGARPRTWPTSTPTTSRRSPARGPTRTWTSS